MPINNIFIVNLLPYYINIAPVAHQYRNWRKEGKEGSLHLKREAPSPLPKLREGGLKEKRSSWISLLIRKMPTSQVQTPPHHSTKGIENAGKEGFRDKWFFHFRVMRVPNRILYFL